MKEEDNWEESATLVREIVVTDDGQKGDFVFRIGNKGKLGISVLGISFSFGIIKVTIYPDGSWNEIWEKS